MKKYSPTFIFPPHDFNSGKMKSPGELTEIGSPTGRCGPQRQRLSGLMAG
jgi:hypothetical protein